MLRSLFNHCRLATYRSARLRRSTGGHTQYCHGRSEEHTSELQSLMRTSYAVFCLKKKTKPASNPFLDFTPPSCSYHVDEHNHTTNSAHTQTSITMHFSV